MQTSTLTSLRNTSDLSQQLSSLSLRKHFTMSARTDDEASAAQTSSGVTPDTLKATLLPKLGATHVQIDDHSGIY